MPEFKLNLEGFPLLFAVTLVAVPWLVGVTVLAQALMEMLP